MLVVDDQVWTAFADRAGGSRLVVAVLDLQRAKVRLDFAAARAGIQLETGLVGNVDLDIAVAIAQLYAAQLAHVNFDSPVFVLQSDVSIDSVQPHIL